jgi:phenylalanyl-tRNA synthetase beta chain
MRVPISWLREFVEIPADATAEDIQAALVRVGWKKKPSTAANWSDPSWSAQVVEFVDEPQANGKTIRWCQLDVGPRVRAGAPRYRLRRPQLPCRRQGRGDAARLRAAWSVPDRCP